MIKVDFIRPPNAVNSQFGLCTKYIAKDWIFAVSECDMNTIEVIDGLSLYVAQSGLAPSDLLLIELSSDECYFVVSPLKKFLKKLE